MSTRRAAVLLTAVLAALATAQTASAGVLDVKVSLGSKADAVRVSVTTPAASADVALTPAAASVDVAAAGVRTSLQTRTRAVVKVPGTTADRPAPPQRSRRVDAAVTPVEPIAPAATTASSGTATQNPVSPPSQTFLPEPATGATGSVAASAAGSAGTTAAIAGLVLETLALLSWTAAATVRTLTPPLLSFALQRPG